MHNRVAVGCEIDDARDGAIGVCQFEGFGGEEGVVGVEVGIGCEVGGELGGGVDDVEGHSVVEEGGPLGGAVGLDGGVAGGGVPGDVVGERGEVGELI